MLEAQVSAVGLLRKVTRLRADTVMIVPIKPNVLIQWSKFCVTDKTSIADLSFVPRMKALLIVSQRTEKSAMSTREEVSLYPRLKAILQGVGNDISSDF